MIRDIANSSTNDLSILLKHWHQMPLKFSHLYALLYMLHFEELSGVPAEYSIGKDIEKACQSIYLLHDVFVRKVKMLKKPKFELGKLMELHGEGSSSGKATGDETGAKVERADGYEPPVQESV
ncbi:40S Ribosomal Protein S3A [Manis pentadactyla]|nr:40S Ribosomal Protein S3A [Manis pentadactyla]